MEAKSFRIGNYVLRDDLGNGSDRFEQILELGQKAITTGPIKVICEYDSLSPIPLTEEWLIKFGFKQLKDGDWSWPYSKYFVIGIEGTFRLFCGNYIGGKLDFVHQLQNILFALTGEELEIKKVN